MEGRNAMGWVLVVVERYPTGFHTYLITRELFVQALPLH